MEKLEKKPRHYWMKGSHYDPEKGLKTKIILFFPDNKSLEKLSLLFNFKITTKKNKI